MAAPAPVLEDLTALGASYGLTRLLAWRDDRLPGPVGGAKARNLRRQLATARAAGRDTLLIAARAGSNLVMAASLIAPPLGFRVCAVLRPQPDGRHARRNLAITLAAGTQVIPVGLDVSLRRDAPKMVEVRNLLELSHHHPHVLGFSGGEEEAGLAHFNAFDELARALSQQGLRPPAAIYMAAASFSSGIGIACGIARRAWPTRLVLVNVAQDEPPTAQEIVSAAERLPALGTGAASSLANIDVEVRHRLGPQFGCIAAEDIERIGRFAGPLGLEPTYTAKAFAALIADATAGEVRDALFWHSGSGERAWPEQLAPVTPPAPLAARLLFDPAESHWRE